MAIEQASGKLTMLYQVNSRICISQVLGLLKLPKTLHVAIDQAFGKLTMLHQVHPCILSIF